MPIGQAGGPEDPTEKRACIRRPPYAQYGSDRGSSPWLRDNVGLPWRRCKSMPRKFSKDPLGAVFGSSIRRLRESRGWTQEQLAEQAEMSVTYLGFIERGENVPTLTIILKLADALNVSPGRLVDEVARSR